MKHKFFLITIFILSLVLRFYHLDSYPALNADEAALGYNAYSLLQTGKDEHGNPWPIHFQSFNDFKPGLYVYLAMPFIKIFGFNELGVRFPGAFIGGLTTIALFYLAKKITHSSRIGFLSAILLAISPWHLHFSRGAWEVNVATFFIVCGVLFFLKGLENKTHWFVSALFFVLSLYTYHAARVVVPLLGIGMAALYSKSLLKNSKDIIIALVFAFLLLIPLLFSFFGPAGISRASGVGLTADAGPESRATEQRGEHTDYSSLSVRLLHNKVINYGLAFLNNWVEHYHGEFLFMSGDEIQRNKVPETGQLYLIEVVTIFVGVIISLKKLQQNKIVLLWLAVGPIAAALTFQSPHALRAHNMVIPLTMLSAIGVNQMVAITSRKRQLVAVTTTILASSFLWCFARYLHMYYTHMAKEYPYSSQYGVKELVNFVKQNQDQYEKIVVTDQYDQPYILFLFYMKYSPQEFQQEHTLTEKDSFGFSTVRRFGKYNFISLKDWGEKADVKGALLAGTPEEIGTGGEVGEQIQGTNGVTYFKIATPK